MNKEEGKRSKVAGNEAPKVAYIGSSVQGKHPLKFHPE